MLVLYLSALAVGLSGALMPGPMLTYTIRQSLAGGPRVGWVVTLGHMSLELAVVVLIFQGFGSLLQASLAQIIIGSAGGLLLLYMGLDMVLAALRNKVQIQTEGGAAPASILFLSGVLLSATNPYFLLWWAVIGLGFIMKSFTAFGLIGIVVYFIGHSSADYLWYGFVSTLVGKTRQFIQDKPYRILIAVLGCVLVYFGSSFLLGAIQTAQS